MGTDPWTYDVPTLCLCLCGAAPWVASSTTHPSPANRRGTSLVGWGRGTAKLLGIR